MILLSLLGEQPIPNLLPLWQAGAPYAATQFAATKATLPLAQALAEAIRHDPQLGRLTVLPPITLEAYDIRQARARLAEVIAQHQLNGQAVTVNLTGGTKLMSFAALQAAFGSACRCCMCPPKKIASFISTPMGRSGCAKRWP